MVLPEEPPDLDAIRRARERIGAEVLETPCSETQRFSDQIPGRLHLKFENLQLTGSFKVRGALNRLLHLSPEEREQGVVTASAGNHAQALAYHSARLRIPCTVVMPQTTPLIKVQNTRSYGARVELVGATFDGALAHARSLEASEDWVMIHAFDDYRVIEGQGTLGLELLEQVPDMDTVLVPIGGGGLVSGVASAVKAVRPQVRIVGVESASVPSARASVEAGRVVEMESADTIADGIAVKRVGDRTFPLIRDLVDDLVVVDDDAVARAILLLLEREKSVVEGAGAASLAALIAGVVAVEPEERVVALLCGGNIDVNMISRIIDRGLVRDGRLARLVATVRDRPGALARLTELVAATGANVLEVFHQRAFADLSVGDVEIVLQIETRGPDHVDEILQVMEERGIRVRKAL